jgi:hypothetical protein
MVDGLLREADHYKEEENPFMKPIGVQSPTVIQTIRIEGQPTSVWYTPSFHHRLNFLYKGRIAISYPDGKNIVPLSVRLDVDDIIKIEKTED